MGTVKRCPAFELAASATLAATASRTVAPGRQQQRRLLYSQRSCTCAAARMLPVPAPRPALPCVLAACLAMANGVLAVASGQYHMHSSSGAQSAAGARAPKPGGGGGRGAPGLRDQLGARPPARPRRLPGSWPASLIAAADRPPLTGASCCSACCCGAAQRLPACSPPPSAGCPAARRSCGPTPGSLSPRGPSSHCRRWRRRR